MSQNWTDSQRNGIETVGSSLLVAAAAGSGKTAVLAARCVHMVCDAKDKCDVDELLVMTFTESAAAEMRERIGKTLRERAEGDAQRLRQQLALLDHAPISTVHSFCSRLLRQNFHRAEVDPAFVVLDADEARLLRLEVAEELFESHYERDERGTFRSLVDDYGDGQDEGLIDRVIRTHELLNSLVDPDKWIADCRGQLRDAGNKPLKDSRLGKQFMEEIRHELRRMGMRCDATIEKVRELGFESYALRLREYGQIIAHLGTLNFNDLRDAVLATDLPIAPKEKSTKPNKELAKAIFDEVAESLKKDGTLYEWVRFSEEERREGEASTLLAAEMFLDLVSEFGERYTAAKDALHALDFSDLERKALNVLRDPHSGPSEIARGLHREFKHVLVDEYQDINEIQDAILNLASRECVAREGKLKANWFAVGDVKQSIFRFRLAEPRRFLEKNDEFRKARAPGQVIDLRENFRSREPLLEAINETFGRLMSKDSGEIEYDETHQLRAGAKFGDDPENLSFAGSPIELHVLPIMREVKEENDSDEEGETELERGEIEAMLLAKRIGEITGADGGKGMNVNPPGEKPRRAKYSDIVILLRSLKFKADAYADVLRKSRIPVYSEGGTGFFEATEVRDVLALLRILDNQQQDIPLAAVLRSPLANLPEPEESLAKIRAAVKGQEGDERKIPFHRAVVKYAETGGDELAARLRDFLAEMKEWRDRARRQPLAQLLWEIYDQTGYLAFCGGLEDGRQRVANLIHLHERAGQFGTFARQGLHRFILFLQTLREDGDWRRPTVPGEEDDVVRIMSIHRSKGLEFPIVCLADIGKRFNLADCQGPILVDRKKGLGMSVIDHQRRIRYPSMAHALVKADLRRQTLAEELRLLYVAMTRVKEHLILVGTAGERSMEKWISRWTGHQGKLPAEEVLGANCVMDWIVPVYAATGGIASKVMQLHQHGAEEIAAWKIPGSEKREISDEQKAKAALKPLEPAPAVSAEAKEILARFEWAYPHREFTRLGASKAVTSLIEAHGSGQATSGKMAEKLDLPAFASEIKGMSAADRGSATHLVLEHLDFSRACDEADVAEQIGEMVDRKLILSRQAEVVDLPAIRWFLGTELGKLLRGKSKELLRELPFAMSEAPGRFAAGLESGERMDQVMVRGRIDLLVPVEGGFDVVDYKTDRVDETGIAARVGEYSAQLAAYRQAIEKIGGKRVPRIHLVFLTPRVIWSG